MESLIQINNLNFKSINALLYPQFPLFVKKKKTSAYQPQMLSIKLNLYPNQNIPLKKIHLPLKS